MSIDEAGGQTPEFAPDHVALPTQDPEDHVETLSVDASWRSSFISSAWTPLLFAIILFAANNVNLLRAWLAPPPGWKPMFVIRDPDIAQHLTWIAWMRDHWLAPDFHAPFITRPGLFSPLMLSVATIARPGIDPALVYVVAVFLTTIAASYALFSCLRIFTTSLRQAYAVLMGVFCVAPIRGYTGLVRFVAGGPHLMLDHGTDGFLLGSQLTCAVGTAGVLITLALLGAYVRSGKRVPLIGAGATTGIFAFLHPFEVFAIMTGATFAFLCLRWPRVKPAIREALFICVPGIAGVLPYAWLSRHVDWIGRAARMNSPDIGNLRGLLALLGVPAVIALAILITGPRLRKPTDILLQCWFAATIFVFNVPGLPYRNHFVDGLGVVTALLVIRQFSTVEWLRRLQQRHRSAVMAAAGILLALGIGVHAAYRYALFAEGNQIAGSVAPPEETGTIAWLREHAKPEELALVPPQSAPWVATIPMHSFASHWLFSLDYQAQLDLSREFYSGAMGEEGSRAFLRRYGINYVAVPMQSPAVQALDVRNRVSQIGSWYLYYFPENRMQRYAGSTG
jgi:hypothetical protein